eukprot:7509859-Pyramimonas_sp.AAC.1
MANDQAKPTCLHPGTGLDLGKLEGGECERERLTQTHCSTLGERWCGERGLTHQGSLELGCG